MNITKIAILKKMFGGGGTSHDLEDAIITRTLTEYRNERVSNIGEYAFYSCESLTTVDLPNATSIGAYAFHNCNTLTALLLRSDTMCNLSSTVAFDLTPIKRGTGYIYVPSLLIDTYKAATNWVIYADQFRALEDYTVDGTTTGPLDESKVNA